jgi:glycerol-3-phosphate acyltransferase PlsY
VSSHGSKGPNITLGLLLDAHHLVAAVAAVVVFLVAFVVSPIDMLMALWAFSPAVVLVVPFVAFCAIMARRQQAKKMYRKDWYFDER